MLVVLFELVYSLVEGPATVLVLLELVLFLATELQVVAYKSGAMMQVMALRQALILLNWLSNDQSN